MKPKPLPLAPALLLTCALIAGLATPRPVPAAEVYKFGVVPQQNGSRLARIWTPLLQYLEARTGYRFQFATARNIPTFEKRLHSGKYDFAYMNPFHYVESHATAGYQAFAKARSKRLKGIIVVKKATPFKTLDDLDDADMAFPSNAFAANLVPRAILREDGIRVHPHYVASHDSVYRNIARGRYAAGGGVMRTYRNAPAELRDKLRILWSSDGYTPHAFAASPRVPQDVVEKVQAALLKMDQDAEGRALLQTLRLKGIERARDEEWDDVRKLNLKS